jgi:hypothetical protein
MVLGNVEAVALALSENGSGKAAETARIDLYSTHGKNVRGEMGTVRSV